MTESLNDDITDGVLDGGDEDCGDESDPPLDDAMIGVAAALVARDMMVEVMVFGAVFVFKAIGVEVVPSRWFTRRSLVVD